MITFRTAGLNIGFDNRYDQSIRFRGFLTDAEPVFTVSVDDADIEAESRFSHYNPAYLEYVCAYRKIAERLPDYDAFVFHGAVITKDGGAFVFTAPSGTGKTTHVKLWEQCYPDCWVLSGDKPIIRKHAGVFCACGTPWRGKEGMGSRSARDLTAFCVLERAEENHIARTQDPDIVRALMHQVYLPQDPQRMLRQLTLMDECFRSVPIFRLGCNMDPEAARVAYEGMKDAIQQPGS